MTTENTHQIKILDEISSPRAKGKRLKRLRNLANLTRRDLEQYNINLNTLKGWEVGRHGGLTNKGAVQIIKALRDRGVDCQIDWLLYGLGRGPRIFERLDGVAEGEGSYSVEEPFQSLETGVENKKILQELIYFRQKHQHILDFIIEDDGMSPFYVPGEYVAGIRRTGKQIVSAVNKDCIVQTDNGLMVVRRLKSTQQPDLYHLICLNPHTTVAEPIICNAKVVSVAPIIWIRRRNG
jgi:hypothetical protein